MPAWPTAEVAACAARLRLALDARRRRHGQGSRMGAGPGASLEFHDHRAYTEGDDLRHLDWGVYGRTEQLVLRRHRVEVAPVVEVILDASASMAAHPGKFAAAAAIAALLLLTGDGARTALWACGATCRVLGGGRAQAWIPELAALNAAGAAGLDGAQPPLRAGAERVLISDGLCPGGATAVVRRLGANAGRICLVQLLAAAERDPAVAGPVRLEDPEGGTLDLVLDDDTCAAYRTRLARLQGDWQRALSGRGVGVIAVAVEDGLAAHARALLAAGVLEPRV